MTHYVLDTNTITFILQKNPNVIAHFESVLTTSTTILGCPIVWYEIHRGLLARDAKSQMKRFVALFSLFEWQDYAKADWLLAATLWQQRRIQGLPIADADLLIAAFTRNRQATLITDNEKDFVQLGLVIENWK